jgi:hypothetical protein
MDLKSIKSLGRVEKKFELLKGYTLTLHTLSSSEMQDCISEIPNGLSDAHWLSAMNLALLSYSTSHINDEVITLEQAKEFYKNLQITLLNDAALFLGTLKTEQDAVLEELKKKV